MIDERGGPTVEEAPTVAGGRQLACPPRLCVCRHIAPQIGVGFDLDDEEPGTIRQVPPSPFNGDEEGSDGGARFNSIVFGYCSYCKATIADNVDMDGVWGIDTMITVN